MAARVQQNDHKRKHRERRIERLLLSEVVRDGLISVHNSNEKRKFTSLPLKQRQT